MKINGQRRNPRDASAPNFLPDPLPDGSIAGIPLLNSSRLVRGVKDLQSSMQQDGMCECRAHVPVAGTRITRYQNHDLESGASSETNPEAFH